MHVKIKDWNVCIFKPMLCTEVCKYNCYKWKKKQNPRCYWFWFIIIKFWCFDVRDHKKTVPHQRLAVVVLCIRVDWILGAGVAVVLLWRIQRQWGLVPAWTETTAVSIYRPVTLLERVKRVSEPKGGEWKGERGRTKPLEKQEGNPERLRNPSVTQSVGQEVLLVY